MIRRLGIVLSLLGLCAAQPASAFDPARIERLAERVSFAGAILIARGDTIIYERAFGDVTPGSGHAHRRDARWRWASITKQILATITMQEVEAGRIDLDGLVRTYWPGFEQENGERITVRHLLRHLSGLPDPEETGRLPSGLPSFYSGDMATEDYCMQASRAAPGAAYRYNNCDYIILGRMLEAATGQTLDALIAERIPGDPLLFPHGGETVPGFHFGTAEPEIVFATYGGAGGMNGTLRDLWLFDRALMRGELLGEIARETLWTGDPAHGYHALGQWVLPVRLAGCAEPVRLVERHGAIGGVQGRNFIVPDADIAVIAFTNRSEGEFAFGQVWRGAGFAHDLLAEAVCHWSDE